MKNYFSIIGLACLLFSTTSALAKDEKIDIKDRNIDFVAVKGTPWQFEYFVDKKAKLCFAVRGQGISNIPCQNLVDGYPELKSVLHWTKQIPSQDGSLHPAPFGP